MQFWTVNINENPVQVFDSLLDAMECFEGIVAALPVGYNNRVDITDQNGSYWNSNKLMRGCA